MAQIARALLSAVMEMSDPEMSQSGVQEKLVVAPESVLQVVSPFHEDLVVLSFSKRGIW
jgi:hypothetical protein